MPVLKRVLNLTRVADLLYKGEDGFTRVGKVTKDSVASVCINPVPLYAWPDEVQPFNHFQ
ncbi:unnamed protein product [Prunus armeniaca]|uniref:Uncharacterized protein n=1 Tax=Prunus armeniaca TaxID=36596 RepID=A0A6J5Y3I2_PRUAR|nr:unnamed protein product [Prunus armeniaca]